MSAQRLGTGSTTDTQRARVLLYDRDGGAARLLANRLVRDGLSPDVVDRFATFVEAVERDAPDLLVVGLDRTGGQSQLEVLSREWRPPVLAVVWSDGDVDMV